MACLSDRTRLYNFPRVSSEYIQLYDGSDNYADFTSRGGDTDPYHPHSGTKRSAEYPSGTPLSSDMGGSRGVVSLRNDVGVPQDAGVGSGSAGWIHPPRSLRHPGVTF